ncbi:hypothetical protein RWV98_04675 [Agathobaculum sp. NTUH-O15-33]|uniref:hypothetical protein n=1 Tax=Agathobaculum sp. NTUH-O15-33 TaxID=3079302 RepID=UPI0029584D8D|nr:hypothetical protein [Agathobaculum sp. NTUH-O15-33]WNX85575.1 hypothetical protein RWV98_04675 [Agathobaculum sp. NTUH-O15-33]
MSLLIPDYVFDSIYEITPALLAASGVRGVLFDLDGTIASHKAALPPEALAPFFSHADRCWLPGAGFFQ